MKPWRCIFGLHDWRQREGALTHPARVLGVDVRERFEQCRRCDLTRDGWPPEPPRPPRPLPWTNEDDEKRYDPYASRRP